jgi:hypothetical protein
MKQFIATNYGLNLDPQQNKFSTTFTFKFRPIMFSFTELWEKTRSSFKKFFEETKILTKEWVKSNFTLKNIILLSSGGLFSFNFETVFFIILMLKLV